MTKKGAYMNQYLCKHVGIRANLHQARNWDSCNKNFGFSSSFDSNRDPDLPKFEEKVILRIVNSIQKLGDQTNEQI